MYPQSIKREVITDLKLSLEEQFIINCLRLEYGGISNEEFPEFNFSTIDWNLVYEKSIKLRIASLLYKITKTRLQSHHILDIPDYFFQKMNTKYIEIYNKNKANFEKLADILDAFNKAGIKVILLKGAYLAQFVYEDIALRSMNDIDILVREKDLNKAEELLLQLGYDYDFNRKFYKNILKSGYNLQKITDNQKREIIRQWFRLHHFHLPMFRHSHGIKLEVHWQIVNPAQPLNIEIGGLWKRAQLSTIEGINTLILCPEDLVLHLCLHYSLSHGLQYKKWIKTLCDISQIIKHYEDKICWDDVYFCACQWGITRPIYLTLLLIRELLKVDVPKKIFTNFKMDDIDKHLVYLVNNSIFIDYYSLELPKNLIRLWGTKRIRDKVFIFLKSAFPSPTIMATIYNKPPRWRGIYFYYPLRLKDLIFRYGFVISLLLYHDKKTVARVEAETKAEINRILLKDWLQIG